MWQFTYCIGKYQIEETIRLEDVVFIADVLSILQEAEACNYEDESIGII